MPKDIFKEDPKFSQSSNKGPSNFKEGITYLYKGFQSIAKGIGSVCMKKIPTYLILILLIAAASFYLGKYISDEPQQMLVNQTNLARECKEITCPTTECICKNNTIEIIKIQCSDGQVVDTIQECNSMAIQEFLPIANETLEIVNESPLILNPLTLDWVNITLINESEDLYSLTRMNVTVFNNLSEKIIPKIEIRLLKKGQSAKSEEYPIRNILFDDLLGPKESISVSEKMIVNFEELPKVIHLKLLDTVPDPDSVIVEISKEIKSVE